jgi:UDP-N-acetylmuramate--alanine ligase
MSGIAEVLMQSRLHGAGLGRRRQRQRQAAARQGRQGSIGHSAENVDGAEVLVVSSAIKRDNPELCARATSACRWCAAPRCWPS